MSKKIKTTDFGTIHDRLNEMILGEVKRVLNLVPEQWMQGPSLCRIMVSKSNDYKPKDVAVDNVWLHEGKLFFDGHVMPPDWQDANIEPEPFEGGEDDGTDWLDITDFHYLIEQAKDKIPAEAWKMIDPISLTNYGEMNAVREALEKTFEY